MMIFKQIMVVLIILNLFESYIVISIQIVLSKTFENILGYAT